MAEKQQERTRWSGRGINERRIAGERRHTDAAVPAEQRVEVRRAVDRRQRVLAPVRRGIDYLFFLLYAFFALRIVLTLVDANEQAGFVQFVFGITQPFYAPFANIVGSPAVDGGQLDLPALIALFAYALLHAAVRKLIALFAAPASTR